MPPSEYQRVRRDASASSSSDESGGGGASLYHHSAVRGRPYLPNLNVDAAESAATGRSAALAATSVVLAGRGLSSEEISSFVKGHGLCASLDVTELKDGIEVMKVSGGITNALFRVGGLRSLLSEEGEEEGKQVPDSVLIRVFGAEGMIDRDVETSTYAALCDAGAAYRYLGRFGNGRVEGWLDGFAALTKTDLQDAHTSLAIASEMAKLHVGFEVPEDLREYHDVAKPAMWTQLGQWMDQAQSHANFRTPRDDDRARALDLPGIRRELSRLRSDVCPPEARVAFCHNDLLAANVMRRPADGKIQLIDFEYGGTNYAAFDVANHFNEHAGGTDEEDNGVANYGLYPNEERREAFVREYVRASKELGGGGDNDDGDGDGDGNEEEVVKALLVEVDAFVLANHLYWGLWAVNQAAAEGCHEFDYLTYAKSRFDRYMEEKGGGED